MGWFSSSPTDVRADAIRTGTAVPTRSERTVCWAARDAYFACLDAHSIVDATKDPGAASAASLCAPQSADFERDCAAAWVKYFKQWRVADIQKQRRLEELRKEGAQEMQVTSSFATAPVSAAGKPAAGREDLQDMLDKKRGR
ncbi:Cytochrome c oxidase subunit 6B-like protein new16 [Paramyrothecium foliicola]|nr:Cytochrome c oxidase subunit 6B-like protein new16 [Paramyrothecium foliicola]